MTNESLARSYLRKASDRLDILDLLMKKAAYSDVVREAQEIVELALKGMLRAIGIEPPKLHDVGGLLQEHREGLSTEIAHEVDELAVISKALRKERELAFYGDFPWLMPKRRRMEPRRSCAWLGVPSIRCCESHAAHAD